MQTWRVIFNAMASGCEVVVAADSQAHADALAAPAIDEVRRIENKYSRYRDDSILARINAAAGRAPVACDAETWSLLEYANALHALSDGLFDITSGVLRRAWDFRRPYVPAQAELASLLGLIGWGRVERSNLEVRLPLPGMELDFGGFGKEYAADRAGAILETQGVKHGYVNLAGDIRAVGPKPDGKAWQIGIQDPRARGKVMASIPLERGGLATSGDYERFFDLDGQRYCHILNPKTGMPVNRWRTVSAVAPLAVMAGSATTIAMLKEQDGLAYLQASGLDFLAVDHDATVYMREASRPQLSTSTETS